MLNVVGSNWDHCIAPVGFGEHKPRASFCGENLIAVGMASGNISLCN